MPLKEAALTKGSFIQELEKKWNIRPKYSSLTNQSSYNSWIEKHSDTQGTICEPITFSISISF